MLLREIAASVELDCMSHHNIPAIFHAIKTNPRIRTDLAPAFQKATPPKVIERRSLLSNEQTPCDRQTTEPDHLPQEQPARVTARYFRSDGAMGVLGRALIVPLADPRGRTEPPGSPIDNNYR
ncbi:hypothetical protein AUP68_14141 [Ilyonectria robusta]